MKRFLLLSAAVLALGSTGCNFGNPCRQTLINWNWFNRGDNCCQTGYSSCGYTPSGCDTCATSGGGPIQGEAWTAPRGANFGSEELVPPGPMNIVPRG